MANYQPWIWTELLAFDNMQQDFGVFAYLAKTGFIPEVICIMSSTSDIVFLHTALAEEVVLSPAICSRGGHGGNEERARQNWTNWQLKALIDNLHRSGVKVYLSLFTTFYQNKYHHEWISDHPEALQEWDFKGKGLNLNITHRLNDGTYVEDIFIDKLVAVAEDYGFDGWHGPDGFGPLTSGSLAYSDCADDTMGQFSETLQVRLPECVTCRANGDVKILQQRMAWIWANVRIEWIHFNTNRWASFWTKVTAALHKINKKTAINSAWTKACFEAEYRYGIDYKKIMDTHVDCMVVETVATGVSLSDGGEQDWHYEYLAMLMTIKAYAPNLKLITLHGVKDVVENWDLLRHAPTMLQREFYSLANVYYGGKRVSDGFLTCLGDGIKPDEWKMLGDLWKFSFAGESKKQGSVTVIWSDEAHRKLFDDYLQHGTWSVCRQMQYLLERGAQIQNIDRIENIERVRGTIFIANSHLLNSAELEKIGAYRNGEVVMTTRKNDAYICKTLHQEISSSACTFRDSKLPLGFRDPISYCTVNDEFWDDVTNTLMALEPLVRTNNKNISFMTQVIDENSLVLAVKNKKFTYLAPEITFAREIQDIQVISNFPWTKQKFSGKSFVLTKVPPKGVVVIKVVF